MCILYIYENTFPHIRNTKPSHNPNKKKGRGHKERKKEREWKTGMKPQEMWGKMEDDGLKMTPI